MAKHIAPATVNTELGEMYAKHGEALAFGTLEAAGAYYRLAGHYNTEGEGL